MDIKNGVSTHDDSPTQYEGPHKFFWCSRRLYPWAYTHKKNKKFARFLKKWYVYAKMDVQKITCLYVMVPHINTEVLIKFFEKIFLSAPSATSMC